MKFTKLLCLSIVALSLISGMQAQTISVYIAGPDAQQSPHSGTAGFVTETFNDTTAWPIPTGTKTVQNGLVSSPGLTTFSGTYNFTGSTGAVAKADQYGGAGGEGQYIAMGQYWTGNNNAYSLTLGTDANYFGFWFSAGDRFNTLSLYDDGALLGVFTSADIFGKLNGGVGTITSTGGNIYNTADYYGNPNPLISPNNSSEPYAYVSLYFTTKYDTVVFDNGAGETGFESDNHSVYFGNLTPSGTEVFVTTIPEPSTAMFLIFGASAVFLGSRVRRLRPLAKA